MQPPFLSLIIATYNRRELLRVALHALAKQTYPADRFEVVVVSDGSTDGTHEMVEALADRVPYRLRLIVQQNAGPSQARNRGVEEAHGEVVAFIDDDLEPLADFVEAHARHHVDDRHAAVIGRSIRDPRRRSEEPPWIAWEHAMLEKQYNGWRRGTRRPAGPNNFYSGNVSVRREHVLAVGGYDEVLKRQEDVDLGFRMERDCGVRFVFEWDAVGYHRPTRGFASWVTIPFAYGQLDVVRARKGDLEWNVLRQRYDTRSAPTRILASLALAHPWLSAPVRAALLLVARLCYRLQFPSVPIAAISAIYNLRYLEGAQHELGSQERMRAVLRTARPPCRPPGSQVPAEADSCSCG